MAASLQQNNTVIFGHEVANSLSLISTSLQYVDTVFQTREADPPAIKAALGGAIREIANLGLLVRDFCSCAQGQASKFEIGDLRAAVLDALMLQTWVCRNAAIDVKLECASGLPKIRLEPPKIQQVMLNLCKNAVEAMPQGGCLTVKLYSLAQSVVLEVSDTGVGLPDCVDVFQLFTSTKTGGKGVGLFVVQQIVAAHQGTINHWSEAGRGTTFQLAFPIAI